MFLSLTVKSHGVILLPFYSDETGLGRRSRPSQVDEGQMATVESLSKHAREHPGPDGTVVRNWILNSVPDAEFRHIRPHLEPVHLSVGATIVEQESEVAHAIFPNSGLVSLLVMMSEGRSSEVSVAGCEGVVGVGLLGGLNRSLHSAVVQVAGEAVRISANDLRDFLQ